MISGLGLASAYVKGCLFHAHDHVWLQHAACGEPRKISASIDNVVEVALICCLCVNGFPFVHQRFAALIDNAFQITHPNVFRVLHQAISRADWRQASAAAPAPLATILTFERSFFTSAIALSTAAPTMMAVAVLIIMKNRDFHDLTQFLFRPQNIRAL